VRRLVLAGILAALIAAPAAADESPIAGRDEIVAGRGLVAWHVAWNQWRLGLPARVPGIGRGCISERQPAGVFFLSGNGSSTDEHVITFDCKVPAGSYLFTGLPETLCSDALPNAKKTLDTPRRILACARKGWRVLGDHAPRIVLDGKPIPTGFTVHTPVFRFTMPKRGNVFRNPGVRGGRAAAYGRVALIKPLAPGRHTLIEGVKYANFHNQVLIWNLEVV
jgi:hypothetical protein